MVKFVKYCIRQKKKRVAKHEAELAEINAETSNASAAVGATEGSASAEADASGAAANVAAGETEAGEFSASAYAVAESGEKGEDIAEHDDEDEDGFVSGPEHQLHDMLESNELRWAWLRVCARA